MHIFHVYADIAYLLSVTLLLSIFHCVYMWVFMLATVLLSSLLLLHADSYYLSDDRCGDVLPCYISLLSSHFYHDQCCHILAITQPFGVFVYSSWPGSGYSFSGQCLFVVCIAMLCPIVTLAVLLLFVLWLCYAPLSLGTVSISVPCQVWFLIYYLYWSHDFWNLLVQLALQNGPPVH